MLGKEHERDGVWAVFLRGGCKDRWTVAKKGKEISKSHLCVGGSYGGLCYPVAFW